MDSKRSAKVQALMRQITAEEAAAMLAALRASGYAVTVQPDRKEGFMRVWIEREREVSAALRERTGSWLLALHILREATATLPLGGQRMSVTQAELAEAVGVHPVQVSRAFSALSAVGAVLLKRRAGKSVTWEIDAEYASRLSDAKRDAEIARQRAEVARERGLLARKAAAKGQPLREVSLLPAEPELL